MKTISLIGSTGSIGTQTLSVCKKYGYKVKALAAYSNVSLLALQAKEFAVECVCVYNDKFYPVLKEKLSGTNIKILCGMEGLCEIASLDGVDLFVNSVVGMVGLLPTLTAINKGTDIALANKETLVAGGNLVMSLAKEKNVDIFPIDSEHSAVFQCLRGNKISSAKKIILTGSGGPFFGRTVEQLKNVSVDEALMHPNWSMGKKITIDSATLMNKGLEYIEARWLFDIKDIEVVIHRQSVLHSAVEFDDNSVIGQLGVPDMKIPIQYALMYPERMECDVKPLSLTDYGTLTFDKPDLETFVALKSCIKAINLGYSYPCIVNAVNEVAVSAFLEGKISFLDIGRLIEKSLDCFSPKKITSYEDVLNIDTEAREFAMQNI
ncbi:MAG: 1-deoxy-D-xylulose-5-phosphate reductoisomerase [Oscillospiraceae bacterium]|nr:1-deoxy-D-xylulose-5-phosphate reductoisomerase [Clostridia bacterium]MBR6695799.1 1-deoxy-D-xylulose-5-phosphate reductoisomerase [Oscillospiraceae bacterium]